MGSLWDDLKNAIQKGLTTIAIKGEEYGKIGRIKIDLMNLKKEMDQAFRELGIQAYDHLKAKTLKGVEKEAAVQALIDRIDALKQKVEAKEEEIRKIQEEAETKKKRMDESGEKQTDETSS